jgi:hypothetical protein
MQVSSPADQFIGMLLGPLQKLVLHITKIRDAEVWELNPADSSPLLLIL